VYYQPLPLFHINAFGLTIIQPVLFGGRGVTASHLSITEFWSEVRKYGATHLSLFGPLYNMLYGMPATASDADNPAQVSLGYCPVEIHREFEARFGIKIYSAYALSEAVMVAHTTPDDLCEPGWAGRPSSEMQVRLLDDDGDEVSTGGVGEICVRPRKPQIIFDGYYNDPEGTLAAFKHLWFHTGDLGRFNEQGHLQFVDRKADYLRRRGENISTYEVEQVVLRFPGIAEVAAHGVPADVGEEEVKVCLRLHPGMTEVDHVAFLDHCAAHMPYYAVPRFIEVLDDFPRSPIGRIQKFQLRERGVTDSTFDRETIGYVVTK
jgi:crotonobetaine/carnitine-CoA ligase